jgi:hypothetical protein
VSVPTGENQSYQGLGFYGEGRPPKKRNGLLIAVVVAAVVLVGVTVTLLVVKPKTVATGEPLAVANVTTSSSSKTTSSTKKSGGALQPQATGAPLVPGWTPIAINDGGEIDSDKAFDVPPTWKQVTGMGNSVIVGQASNSAKIYIPVTYMQGYCPTSKTSFRSMAGLLLLPNKGELAPQVTDVAQKIADAVYTTGETAKPKVEMGQQQPVTVNGGKKGIVLTAKATLVPGDNKCDAATATVTVMTFEPKPDDKTILVVAAFADQGFPEATSEEDLKKIVTSVHPAN